MDEGGVSPHHEREANQERVAENLLFALSGGGIIWAGTALQGDVGRNILVVVGLMFLGVGLLMVCCIRFVQVDRYYFVRGEWEKNLKEYNLGEINKFEFCWRVFRVQNERSKHFTIISIASLLVTSIGYVLIIAGFPSTA